MTDNPQSLVVTSSFAGTSDFPRMSYLKMWHVFSCMEVNCNQEHLNHDHVAATDFGMCDYDPKTNGFGVPVVSEFGERTPTTRGFPPLSVSCSNSSNLTALSHVQRLVRIVHVS